MPSLPDLTKLSVEQKLGRDGKMAGYAALVLATATSRWWALRR